MSDPSSLSYLLSSAPWNSVTSGSGSNPQRGTPSKWANPPTAFMWAGQDTFSDESWTSCCVQTRSYLFFLDVKWNYIESQGIKAEVQTVVQVMKMFSNHIFVKVKIVSQSALIARSHQTGRRFIWAGGQINGDVLAFNQWQYLASK